MNEYTELDRPNNFSSLQAPPSVFLQFHFYLGNIKDFNSGKISISNHLETRINNHIHFLGPIKPRSKARLSFEPTFKVLQGPPLFL